MKKYFYVTRNAIQGELTYGASYWTSLFGILIKMTTSYYLWQAIFGNRTEVGGYNFSEMITYVLLSMMLSQLNAFGAGRMLSLMIARGEIAMELVRPYQLIVKLLFYNMGVKIVEVIKYTIIMWFISSFFFKISISGTFFIWMLFIASSLLGMITIQLIDVLLSMLAFKTTNTWGIWILRNSLFTILSGAMLPLTLFPRWFQKCAYILPFQSAIYAPLNIITSRCNNNILYSVFLQTLWAIILVIFVSISYKRAVKKVTIWGG